MMKDLSPQLHRPPLRAATTPILGGAGVEEGGLTLVDNGFRSFIDLLCRLAGSSGVACLAVGQWEWTDCRSSRSQRPGLGGRVSGWQGDWVRGRVEQGSQEFRVKEWPLSCHVVAGEEDFLGARIIIQPSAGSNHSYSSFNTWPHLFVLQRFLIFVSKLVVSLRPASPLSHLPSSSL